MGRHDTAADRGADVAEDSVEDSALLEQAYRDPASGLSTAAPENGWTLFKLWHRSNRPRALRTARGDSHRMEGWLRGRQHAAAQQYPAPAEATKVVLRGVWAGAEFDATWVLTSVAAADPDRMGGDGVFASPRYPGDPSSEWTWKVVRDWKMVDFGSCHGFRQAMDAASDAAAFADLPDDLSPEEMWRQTGAPDEMAAHLAERFGAPNARTRPLAAHAADAG